MFSRKIHALLLLLVAGYAQGLESTAMSRRQALRRASSVAAAGLWNPSASAKEEKALKPTQRLSNGIAIPRIGYSLYKTQPAPVAVSGVRLALAAGVRHFDVATQYGTNDAVASVLRDYIQRGAESLEAEASAKPFFLESIPRSVARRQTQLFVSHKVSNAEQALAPEQLQATVLAQRDALLGSSNKATVPNFMALIHSPLTNREQRLRTYAALVDLYQQGRIAAVGVCHYGVTHLDELVNAGLPPPHVIQLVLSPFQPHADVAAWARQHGGSTLECSAWSKLSSSNGPVTQWTQLGQLAATRGVTKQQILIRWAMQSGYLCVPRSGAQYKVEKAAIRENSWASVRKFVLSQDEMDFLNSLDVQVPAGQLGVTDGWDAADIVDEKWDPTLLSVFNRE